MNQRFAQRERKAKEDFDEVFEKYKEAVKEMSGGLVETDKAEFIKLAAFTQVVINPSIEQIHKTLVNLNGKR